MESKAKLRPDSNLRLMHGVKQVLHDHHYSYRTEHTYCDLNLRYVKSHRGKTHPNNTGKKEAAVDRAGRGPQNEHGARDLLPEDISGEITQHRKKLDGSRPLISFSVYAP
jgi:hypothetical protein